MFLVCELTQPKILQGIRHRWCLGLAERSILRDYIKLSAHSQGPKDRLQADGYLLRSWIESWTRVDVTRYRNRPVRADISQTSSLNRYFDDSYRCWLWPVLRTNLEYIAHVSITSSDQMRRFIWYQHKAYFFVSWLKLLKRLSKTSVGNKRAFTSRTMHTYGLNRNQRSSQPAMSFLITLAIL